MKIEECIGYVKCTLEKDEVVLPEYLKYLLEFLTNREGVLIEKEKGVYIYKYIYK